MAKGEHRRVAAIKVRQWLAEWDEIKFSPEHRRREPEHHFYVFSIPAMELRALCGINRRQVKGVGPRSADMGIQREHEPERSDEIARYVKYGFPWSTLRRNQRELTDYKSMRKPGWLPTAIVVNILQPSDRRDDQAVAQEDILTVQEGNGISHLQLPYQKWERDWRPSGYPPLEVIDGQHRLWAFENDISDTDYEVPVVAFNGLDISWQAYSRFYHVLETISKGRCGPVEGAGRYPDAVKRPKSSYSLKQDSEDALDDLLGTVSSKGARAILTFPAHNCSNGLSGDIVQDIAEVHFRVQRKIVKSTFSTLGGTGIDEDDGGRNARHSTDELILLLRPI